MMSFVACPSLKKFSTSHKRQDFRKKLLKTKCVLIFSVTFVCTISHSKKKWARYDKKMYIGLNVKCPFSCLILMKLEFSQQIFEKSPNIKFHVNPSSRNRVVHADGRTGMTELIAVFRNFSNAPKHETGKTARYQINSWWHNSSSPSQEFCS